MSTAQAIARTMVAVLLRGHGGYEQLDLRDDVPVRLVFESGNERDQRRHVESQSCRR